MSDGQTPLLHSNGARRGSPLWQLFSACRWLKEALVKPGRKGNIQPGDNGRTSGPRHLPSVKEHPTIEWDVVRKIFPDRGDDVDQLRDWQSAGSITTVNENMVLTKESAEKTIEIFGDNAIVPEVDMEMILIHHILDKEGIEYAEVLFQHAISQGKEVKLRWNGGDVLKAALDKYSRESVQFVLEKMSQRGASPAETIQVLTENMETLLQRFPYVIAKFLKDGKFCFKFGTFRVPKSVFDGTDTRPIGFVCDHIPQELKWRGEDEEVKEFWELHHAKVESCFTQSTNEEHVTAVSKFIALDDAIGAGHTKSIVDLTAAKCSVDVFKCETMRTIVQWKWHNYHMFAFVRNNSIVYLTSVFFFFLFAIIYGDIASDGEAKEKTDVTVHDGYSNQRLAQVSLVCSFLALVLTGVLHSSSPFWSLVVGGVGSEIYLLIHVFHSNKHNNFSAIVVSVHCLTILVQILRYLRPFRWFGPFVTMFYSFLWDLQPLTLMGSIVVIDFGIALFVLLGRSHQSAKDEQSAGEERNERSQESVDDLIDQYRRNFSSIWRCFEYLLYTIVGNFETDVFHLSTDGYMTGWITFFFSLYVLLAAIVLLSLLISALGDTFDRVLTHAEAEYVKHRAKCIAAFEQSYLRWKRYWYRSRSAFSIEHYASLVKYYYSDGQMKPIGDKLAVFHFLVPQDEAVIPAEDKAPWHGRIHAVAKVTQELIEKEKEEAKAERDRLAKHMSKVEERIEKLEGTIQQKLDDASKKNAEMLEQILEQMKQTQNETNIKSSDLESEEASLQNAAA